MDFEEKYKGRFSGLETSVGGQYQRGLEAIRKSDDPEECLSELNLIFKAAKTSRYRTDRSPEWSGDLIKLYRNLGEIFATVLPNYGKLCDITKTEREDLEKKFELEYSSLLDKIEVDIEFEGENDREILQSILGSYNEFRKVIYHYNIEDSKELKSRLGDFDMLEKKCEELEKRLQEKEDFEKRLGL